jgi:hypothetical protein
MQHKQSVPENASKKHDDNRYYSCELLQVILWKMKQPTVLTSLKKTRELARYLQLSHHASPHHFVVIK